MMSLRVSLVFNMNKPGVVEMDVDDVLEEGSFSQLDETERMKFGKQILFYIFIICAGVIIGYSMNPDNKALINVFEMIKIGVLPLVTFVIAFYFPSNK
jgi:hypothetical protein